MLFQLLHIVSYIWFSAVNVQYHTNSDHLDEHHFTVPQTDWNHS